MNKNDRVSVLKALELICGNEKDKGLSILCGMIGIKEIRKKVNKK